MSVKRILHAPRGKGFSRFAACFYVPEHLIPQSQLLGLGEQGPGGPAPSAFLPSLLTSSPEKQVVWVGRRGCRGGRFEYDSVSTETRAFSPYGLSNQATRRQENTDG